MSDEKQIEEMALAICKSRGVAYVDDCRKCRQHGDCLYQDIARGLYKADYRKQSEGEWEQVGDDCFDLCFRCSNCREEFSCEVDMSIFAKFCPECGAKMKGGE